MIPHNHDTPWTPSVMSRHDARNGPGGDRIRDHETVKTPSGGFHVYDPLAPEPARRAQEWAWVLGALAVALVALTAMIGTIISNESHVRGPHIKVIHEQTTR